MIEVLILDIKEMLKCLAQDVGWSRSAVNDNGKDNDGDKQNWGPVVFTLVW